MTSRRVNDISPFHTGGLRSTGHPPGTNSWRSGSVRICVQNENATGKGVDGLRGFFCHQDTKTRRELTTDKHRLEGIELVLM